MSTENSTQITLIRGLGLIAAISIIIGNVIGTGVFLKARVMTCNVGSPTWVLLAWIAAGILSLAGALTYAELAAMMPKAGGEYVFLKNAYGRVWSFLYGWMQILIAKTGSQAAVAVGFTLFLNSLMGGSLKQVWLEKSFDIYSLVLKAGFPFVAIEPYTFKYELTNLQFIGLFLIALFTLLNFASVRFSGGVATFLTVIKIGLVLFVGVGAFLLASGDFSHISQTMSNGTCEGVSPNALFGSPEYTFATGFGAAMLGALWGYDGWNNLALVAGEVKEPHKNIPLALVGGTIVIILLYVFANLAYFYVLTPTEIASVSSKSSVAIEVAQKFLGPSVVSLMAIGLMASSIGTLHTSILTGARVPYAMAQDKMFFQNLAKLSSTTRVPIGALILQGIWAGILVLSGSFDTLTDYVIFGSWIFYGLTTASIFVFRMKYPGMERPYRAFGYPIVPVLFLFVTAWLLINTLMTSPQQALTGIFLIALGLPLYYYLTRQNTVLPNSVDE
jgi:APA family basic amino acid/polyamine antiporter